MSVKDSRINFDGQTLFKVQRGETLTVPDTVTAASPAGLSSGLSPSTIFDSKRAVVGGMIFTGFSDAAGPTQPDDIRLAVRPGDVIAVSSATTAVVTINGATVATITNTSVAGVLGFYA